MVLFEELTLFVRVVEEIDIAEVVRLTKPVVEIILLLDTTVIW